MEEFKLEGAKGVLKKCTTLRTKAPGESKERITANDFELTIQVDERSEDAVDFLFPGYEQVEKHIAGRDGTHRGMKLITKTPVAALNVEIADSEDNTGFVLSPVFLVGAPALGINSLGDSTMFLRLEATLTKKEMGKLLDYMDADIHVTAELAQPELPLDKPEPNGEDLDAMSHVDVEASIEAH